MTDARAIIRFNKTHVSVLCPIGHLITARKLDTTWAGSGFAADVADHQAGVPNAFDRLAAKCCGAGHD